MTRHARKEEEKRRRRRTERAPTCRHTASSLLQSRRVQRDHLINNRQMHRWSPFFFLFMPSFLSTIFIMISNFYFPQFFFGLLKTCGMGLLFQRIERGKHSGIPGCTVYIDATIDNITTDDGERKKAHRHGPFLCAFNGRKAKNKKTTTPTNTEGKLARPRGVICQFYISMA